MGEERPMAKVTRQVGDKEVDQYEFSECIIFGINKDENGDSHLTCANYCSGGLEILALENLIGKLKGKGISPGRLGLLVAAAHAKYGTDEKEGVEK